MTEHHPQHHPQSPLLTRRSKILSETVLRAPLKEDLVPFGEGKPKVPNQRDDAAPVLETSLSGLILLLRCKFPLISVHKGPLRHGAANLSDFLVEHVLQVQLSLRCLKIAPSSGARPALCSGSVGSAREPTWPLMSSQNLEGSLAQLKTSPRSGNLLTFSSSILTNKGIGGTLSTNLGDPMRGAQCQKRKDERKK